jgi:hypothetical protein
MCASGEFIERVSPTPLPMLVAGNDQIANTDLASRHTSVYSNLSAWS